VFDVSECQYVIDGITYTSPPIQLTLSAADGASPRIDVVKVDTSSVASIQEGTPAADPAKPEVDPTTELELTFITISALATEPDDVSAQAFYLEDAGDPTEWDATENTAAARITLASVADPLNGTKSILLTAAVTDDAVTLTAGASNDFIPGTMETLELHVKPATWAKKDGFRIAFFNGANRISSWVDIKDKVYGFDRTDANYQTIGIPGADFAFTDVIADSLQLEVYNGTITAHIDDIRAQTGVTVINIFIGLTEEQLINNARTFNATQDFTTVEYQGEAVVLSDLNIIKLAYIGQDLRTTTTEELVLANAGQMVDLDNASAIALTIPANSAIPFPINTRIDLNQGGDGLVTVGITDDTLDVGVGAGPVSQGKNMGMSLWKKSATVWVIYGGTTA
jgi:hypothetical protein